MKVILLGAGFVLSIGLLIALAVYWITVWSESLTALEGWSKKKGYRIVRRSYRTLFRGPYFWMPTTYTVFYVTVEDQDGRERNGWVCCGDQFLGPADENVPIEGKETDLRMDVR